MLIKSARATEKDPRGYVCKLADFGLARVLGSNRTHVSTSTHGQRPLPRHPIRTKLPGACWTGAVRPDSTLQWALCYHYAVTVLSQQTWQMLVPGCGSAPDTPLPKPRDTVRVPSAARHSSKGGT